MTSPMTSRWFRAKWRARKTLQETFSVPRRTSVSLTLKSQTFNKLYCDIKKRSKCYQKQSWLAVYGHARLLGEGTPVQDAVESHYWHHIWCCLDEEARKTAKYWLCRVLEDAQPQGLDSCSWRRTEGRDRQGQFFLTQSNQTHQFTLYRPNPTQTNLTHQSTLHRPNTTHQFRSQSPSDPTHPVVEPSPCHCPYPTESAWRWHKAWQILVTTLNSCLFPADGVEWTGANIEPRLK